MKYLINAVYKIKIIEGEITRNERGNSVISGVEIPIAIRTHNDLVKAARYCIEKNLIGFPDNVEVEQFTISSFNKLEEDANEIYEMTYTKKNILSIDAECNSLNGKAFAIAAVLFDENGFEKSRFIGRCPIVGDIDSWVEQNVLPKIQDISETHLTYPALLSSFMEYFMKSKINADIIAHVAIPVESRLFTDAQDMGIIDAFEGPYPLIDISAFPEIGISVDTYNQRNNIKLVDIGNTHNPIYDCISAAAAYRHILKDKYGIGAGKITTKIGGVVYE
jgi:hypothetical protein